MNSEKLSKVIDTMRLPLIFLVVIAHLAPFAYPVIKFNFSGNNTFVLVSEMFSHHLAKFSVRSYFLVSGFYFFNKYSGDLYSFFKRQYWSRIRTILIPYLVWNFLAALAIFLKNYIFMRLGRHVDEDFGILMNSSIYHNLWEIPINFPLWYLRDLICMIIISPLIFYYVKFFKGYGVIVLGILYLTVIDMPIPGFSTTALFFFTAGAYFCVEKKDMLYIFRKIAIPSFLIMLLFLFLSLKTSGSEVHEYYLRVFIISGVISVFNLFAYLNDHYTVMNKLTGFSSLSFFIYVVHEIYIIEWLKGFFYNHHLFMDGWERFYAYLIIPILCIAICCLIYFTLMKLVPKIFVFSLGGRVPNFNKIERPLSNRSISSNQT